jgi:K+/H+ antiporter YhaU regulatory subunit KhtT
MVQVENRIKFIRQPAGALVGKHPWHSEELDRTGAKVVAVERDGDIMVEFDSTFAVQTDDILFVCGSFNSLERYQKAYKTSNAV